MSSTTAADSASLEGRSAVITGASRGIGLECARVLHGAGARVVLLARGAGTIAQAAADVGSRAQGVQCDVGDRSSVMQAIQRIRELLSGAPDILVHNAGAFHLAHAEETSLDDFEAALRVNLASVFTLTREFLGEMKTRGSGHVVTIGSVADRQAFPGNAAYAASKFGARGLHEVIRAELRGTGVRATLVSPGPTDTSLWDAIDPDTRPGFTPRSGMLSREAVADAVRYVVTRPPATNVDELRLSRS